MAGYRQGVETPWPLVSAQKVYQEDKPQEDIKIWGITGAEEEVSQCRGAVLQGIQTQLSSVLAGTGPQVEAVRGGGWFKEMAEDGQYQEGIIHRSLQVRYRNLGRRKEGKRMEREAAEAARGTGLQGSKGA